MFRKTSSADTSPKESRKAARKESIPSVITRDISVLGNIVSDGNIDFDGTLDGNIRCRTLTIRAHGTVKGEITADSVFVYGRIKGLIRARTIYCYASCNIEGIIIHESITIEDGAFVDGKFKRSDKPLAESEDDNSSNDAPFFFKEEEEEGDAASAPKMLENIRLIR